MQLRTALVALAASCTLAHPGHDPTEEMAVRRDYLAMHKRSLSHCADTLKARGVKERALKRRHAMAESLREKRGIMKRGEHESNEDYTIDTDPAIIFEGESSCILSPEVTEGPYYVAGEYVRTDVVEEQQGVPLFTDIQVINTATCEPVEGAYLEIWHCNSTGVYGGVTAQGNGVGPSDESNLDNTWLRGVQPTDSDGVVQFSTLFPGHYTGRTTHIHVMVHLDATPFANETLISTTAAHVGQTFFDQDLIDAVELLAPYSANTQPLTTNAQDGILKEEQAAGDPIMDYVQLGDSLADGLLAWLSFGIDVTNARNVSAAATYLEDGGHQNENAGGPGGPGGPPPGQTPPAAK